MEENAKTNKPMKRKRIFIVAGCITIIIILILSGLYFVNRGEIDEIEITINLEGTPKLGSNLTVSWEVKNIANETIYMPIPDVLEGTFGYSLKFPNGSVIHNRGARIDVVPIPRSLNPGEVWTGNISFYDCCKQSGTYKIYIKYNWHDSDPTVLSGWKKSNVIEFEIE